jgi:hypothetical protein
LLTSFAVFNLTDTPQSAILYLFPFTLIPIFIIGLSRHELKLLWGGVEQQHLPIFEKRQLLDASGFSKVED